jgi:hypothetical protein
MKHLTSVAIVGLIVLFNTGAQAQCDQSVDLTILSTFNCDSVTVSIHGGGAIFFCCAPPSNLCNTATSITYTVSPCPLSVVCGGPTYSITLPVGQSLVVNLDGRTQYTVTTTMKVDYTYRCTGAFCLCNQHQTCQLPTASTRYLLCDTVDAMPVTWGMIKSLMR